MKKYYPTLLLAGLLGFTACDGLMPLDIHKKEDVQSAINQFIERVDTTQHTFYAFTIEQKDDRRTGEFESLIGQVFTHSITSKGDTVTSTYDKGQLTTEHRKPGEKFHRTLINKKQQPISLGTLSVDRYTQHLEVLKQEIAKTEYKFQTLAGYYCTRTDEGLIERYKAKLSKPGDTEHYYEVMATFTNGELTDLKSY